MKLQTKFQNEDFELGEVVEADIFYGGDGSFKVVGCALKGGRHSFYYRSLKELNEEWEDAPEEPKGSALDLMVLTLTNFIENEPDEDKVDLEDCKQMLEKLKAWKRLKDKGFRFRGYDDMDRGQLGDIVIYAKMPTFEYDDESTRDDLDLLFGGGE